MELKATIAERDKAIHASPSCIALACLHLLLVGIANMLQANIAQLELRETEVGVRSVDLCREQCPRISHCAM